MHVAVSCDVLRNGQTPWWEGVKSKKRCNVDEERADVVELDYTVL